MGGRRGAATLVCALVAACSIQPVHADDTSGITTVSASGFASLTAFGNDVFALGQAYFGCVPDGTQSTGVFAGTSCPTSPTCVATTDTGCNVLFHSSDGGSTWERHLGAGLSAGVINFSSPILVPPSYPADPALFDVIPTGLMRSDDGGNTFLPTGAGGGGGLAIPGTTGDTRILMVEGATSAGTPTLVYDDKVGLVSPGPVLPPDTYPWTYAGDEHHLLVGATGNSSQQGVLELCMDSAPCSVVLVSDTFFYGVVASSNAATDHTVLAWGDHLWLSTDDGATFATLNLGQYLPVALARAALGTGPFCHPLCIIVDAYDPSDDTKGVTLQSTDGGASFSKVGEPVGSEWHDEYAYTANGHILAIDNVRPSPLPLLLCSADSGQTWAAFC